jgi:hypothetical protein
VEIDHGNALSSYQKQHYHCDYSSKEPNTKQCYICLLAVMDGTHLYDERSKQRVNIPTGGVLIARGDWKHSGGNYFQGDHIRFHCYIDCKKSGRKLNTTYDIDENEPEQIEVQLNLQEYYDSNNTDIKIFSNFFDIY